MSEKRKAVIVTHERFTRTGTVVREALNLLKKAGFNVMLIDNSEAGGFGYKSAGLRPDTEIVIVLGGDGTILRAAELTRGTKIPIFGVNLGHVGFLAEFESFQMAQAIQKVADRDYKIDKRMTAHVQLYLPENFGSGKPVVDWALNDVTLEHTDRSQMIEVGISVDNVATSSFGCDGVIVSTPTGSTAYAFSAGGPIIWPDVRALELTPLAAHALFSRPLIIGSDSVYGIEVLKISSTGGWLCCDGRRQTSIPPGSRVEIRQSDDDLRIARLSDAPFAARLVSKFDLPVKGWREEARRRKSGQ